MRETEFDLFCLPFSGASAYSYKPFADHAPSGLRLIPLELPGRGRRLREPLLTDLRQMVSDLLPWVRAAITRPYAVYGHSLGALLGFYLVKELVEAGEPLPLYLFFSGRAGPSIPYEENERHLLPRDQFFDKVLAMGGSPSAVFADEEMAVFFEPILRADFCAAETCVYQTSAPFDIPIDVLIGTDEKISETQAMAWSRETNAGVEVLEFPGNHFFIFDHSEAIMQHISSRLRYCSQVV